MTLIYILLAVLFILWFRLLRTIDRLSKYQSFKSNVILRLALDADMENLKKAEELNLALLKRYHDDALSDLMDTDDYTSIYEDEIIRKISEAIDEEIDSEYIPEWPELMTAIKNSFQFETSMPLSKAFDPQRIIERHKERNREYIKK